MSSKHIQSTNECCDIDQLIQVGSFFGPPCRYIRCKTVWLWVLGLVVYG